MVSDLAQLLDLACPSPPSKYVGSLGREEVHRQQRLREVLSFYTHRRGRRNRVQPQPITVALAR